MGKKAVFLDRDGTINVEKNYLYKIKDFEFLPGVVEALHILQEAGYLLIVITNQSGIGRGYYTEVDFAVLNNWMLQQLESQGIHITDVYYCPHLPDAPIEKYRQHCRCRKPATGMYHRAIQEWDVDIMRSWAIGDKLRDCAICEETACKGFLIAQNESEEKISKVKKRDLPRIWYENDLLTCAREILKRESEFKREIPVI